MRALVIHLEDEHEDEGQQAILAQLLQPLADAEQAVWREKSQKQARKKDKEEASVEPDTEPSPTPDPEPSPEGT